MNNSFPPLGRLIRDAFRFNRAAMDRAMRTHGVTLRQYGVLLLLSQSPGSSGAELARRIDVTPQAMHELVGGLEHDGLVSRRAHDSHGRIRQILLTPLGEKLLEDCGPDMRAVQERLGNRLSPEDFDLLVSLLTRYIGERDFW